MHTAEIAVERVLHLLLTPDSETERHGKSMAFESVGHSEPVQEWGSASSRLNSGLCQCDIHNC